MEQLIAMYRSVYEGPAWHGSSLSELLADVEPFAATERPVAELHTIAEIVAHLASWQNGVAGALQGEPLGQEPKGGDWPRLGDESDGWPGLLARLEESYERLIAAMESLPSAEIDLPLPGREYTARFALEGCLHHVAYHAGQIAMLSKLTRV